MTDTSRKTFDPLACRRHFSALKRQVNGQQAVFFDGPGGSQVPDEVAAAVSRYLISTNANHGGLFATSLESDEILHQAHRAAADFVGARDPDEIAFGANMTTLTFALSRALSRTWKPGDEVVVTRLDHDANVTPWVRAARDAGTEVRRVEINAADCTLDMDDLAAKLGPRTRLVAVSCASNAVGTVQQVEKISQMAHAVGAQVFLDAVHYAPHAAIDVIGWGCDYLACSAYKVFGPHVGILWGRRELMSTLPAYKVRPAPDELPGRWMTGTQNHEGIAGALAAIEYLANIGRSVSPGVSGRREALLAAFQAIGEYERTLVERLLAGLACIRSMKIWGITDPERLAERVPTVSITHAKLPASHLAGRLADRGIFTWHGNFYALPLTETLGLEPEGMLRIGLLHYNLTEEIDRLLEALREIG